MQRILTYTGVQDTYPISYVPQHTSYSDKELQFRQWLARDTPLREIQFKVYRLAGARRFYNKTVRYTALYLAKLIPDRLLSDEPILSQTYLEEIRDKYKDDWQRCLQYANEAETHGQ